MAKLFNWQLLNKQVIKKYVADLIQYGTNAPQAKVLSDTIDLRFTYSYIEVGVYAVVSSRPIFTNCGMGCRAQSTQVTISNSAMVFSSGSITVFPVANDTMIILTVNGSGDASNDILGNFSQNALEITLYPNL